MSELKPHSTNNLDIFSPQTDQELNLPFFEGVRAGFPSPAADFTDLSIDLNKHLIKHPTATFYARARGDSMKDAGINDGDLLIVDKSIEPTDGKIAICYIDGEFTVKIIKKKSEEIWLLPANTAFKPIVLKKENKLIIWGIVTYIIKSL